MTDWHPTRLEIFIAIDLRTLDPSAGIPRQAHKRWLRRVDAGRQRCLVCWQPLKFWTARQPLLIGVVRLGTTTSLMAMCTMCATQNDPDQASAALFEASIGHHGPDRVLVHKGSRQ